MLIGTFFDIIIISTISILQVCMHGSFFLLLVSSSIFFLKIKKGRKNKPVPHYQNIYIKKGCISFFLGFQKLETDENMHVEEVDCFICWLLSFLRFMLLLGSVLDAHLTSAGDIFTLGAFFLHTRNLSHTQPCSLWSGKCLSPSECSTVIPSGVASVLVLGQVLNALGMCKRNGGPLPTARRARFTRNNYMETIYF